MCVCAQNLHADLPFHLFTYRRRAKRVRARFISFLFGHTSDFSVFVCATAPRFALYSARLCDPFRDLTCFIAALNGVCTHSVNAKCTMHTRFVCTEREGCEAYIVYSDAAAAAELRCSAGDKYI